MKKKNRLILKAGLWAVLALGAWMPRASADVPQRMNFQGKLLDTANNPRNGSFNFTFRIFDVPGGGSALWTETQNGVSVSNGVFAVQLGSVTAIPAGVFSGATTYLEIQIGAEVATARERLVASPYAFRASVADDLVPGDSNYIQLRDTLQTGATFYVSSGTVGGPLTVGGALVVGGVLTAGTGTNQITTAAGLVDATKLAGTLPSVQLSGAYSNALTFSNSANAFTGNGSGLSNVAAAGLLPGDTDYIQTRNTLQAGATFYVSSATVGGPFTATGTVTLGGAAGVNDVSVQSNLIVSGAGPHTFTGNVRVNGNNLQDSAGTNRITLGATNRINGDLNVPAGTAQLTISTSVAFVGTANQNNYLAFPFTAGGTVNDRDIVIISGANSVGTTTTRRNTAAIGIAVNSVSAGQTVSIATLGIVTGVVTNAAITVGQAICTSTVAGQVEPCVTSGAPVGKALTGATGAGQTITVVLGWTF